jgi:hypothetical protein
MNPDPRRSRSTPSPISVQPAESFGQPDAIVRSQDHPEDKKGEGQWQA